MNTVKGKINEEQLDPKLVQKIKTTIEELKKSQQENFQSVSNGKTMMASAITDKGIKTLATDKFDVMASNIRNIKTGYASGDNVPINNLNLEYTYDSDPIIKSVVSLRGSLKSSITITPTGNRKYYIVHCYDSWSECYLSVINAETLSMKLLCSNSSDIRFGFSSSKQCIVAYYYENKTEKSYVKKFNFDGVMHWSKEVIQEYNNTINYDKIFIDDYYNKLYGVHQYFSDNRILLELDINNGSVIKKVYVSNELETISFNHIINGKLYCSNYEKLYNINDLSFIKDTVLKDVGKTVIRPIEDDRMIMRYYTTLKMFEYNLRTDEITHEYSSNIPSIDCLDINKSEKYMVYLINEDGGTNKSFVKYSLENNTQIYKKEILSTDQYTVYGKGIYSPTNGEFFRIFYQSGSPTSLKIQKLIEGKTLSKVSIK